MSDKKPRFQRGATLKSPSGLVYAYVQVGENMKEGTLGKSRGEFVVSYDPVKDKGLPECLVIRDVQEGHWDFVLVHGDYRDEFPRPAPAIAVPTTKVSTGS